MSSVEVRPFRRADRGQLADLVNAHAEAVVPGMGTSVAALLASLERQPGEPMTDPWVRERATLVAEQQHRIVGAAHLLRYFADERAGQAYRGLGEISWLVTATGGAGLPPGCSARRPAGSRSRRSTGCSTTLTWTARMLRAATTPATGRSCWPPDSASSPGQRAAGPGAPAAPHQERPSAAEHLAPAPPTVTVVGREV
jgi:hypothetical protein